jgi:hypothetical protein
MRHLDRYRSFTAIPTNSGDTARPATRRDGGRLVGRTPPRAYCRSSTSTRVSTCVAVSPSRSMSHEHEEQVGRLLKTSVHRWGVPLCSNPCSNPGTSRRNAVRQQRPVGLDFTFRVRRGASEEHGATRFPLPSPWPWRPSRPAQWRGRASPTMSPTMPAPAAHSTRVTHAPHVHRLWFAHSTLTTSCSSGGS